jgi:hypothetical protein
VAKPTLTHPNNRTHRAVWGHNGTDYYIVDVDSSGYIKSKTALVDESGAAYGVKQVDGKIKLEK